MSTAFNTRGAKNFQTSRLKSLAGYFCKPAICDAMCFFLPAFRVISSRVVKVGNDIWELWSPNSARSVYYPGLRDVNADLENLSDSSKLRCDGHLGRFDPSVSPQHFDSARPWLGFIRRIGDESHPEYTSLIDVWQPMARPNSGYLKPSYVSRLASRTESVIERVEGWRILETKKPDLWNNRPQFPSQTDIDVLQKNMTFDDAVDRLAKIQRGLKYMSAWCRMAHAFISDSKTAQTPLQAVPQAEEPLMGVWINGCAEEEGLWLMKHRVPCFIIHTIANLSEMERAFKIKPRLPNFVEGTPAAKLNVEIYAFDLAILKDNGRLLDTNSDFAIHPSWMITPYMRTDRMRASPVLQGFKNGSYTDPRYAAPPAETTPLLDDSKGLITPPPVATMNQSGKWTSWKEDETEDGMSCMVLVGQKSSRSLSGKVYYDRKNRRRLHFEDHPFLPPGYEADVRVFGVPAPDFPFFEMGNNNQRFPRPPSTWLYKDAVPAPGTEGAIYSPPINAGPSTPPRRVIEDSSESDDEIDTRSRATGSPECDVPLESVPAVPRVEPLPVSPTLRSTSLKPPLREVPRFASDWERSRQHPEFDYTRGYQGPSYRRRSRSRSPRSSHHRRSRSPITGPSNYSRQIRFRRESPSPRRSEQRFPPRHLLPRKPSPDDRHSRPRYRARSPPSRRYSSSSSHRRSPSTKAADAPLVETPPSIRSETPPPPQPIPSISLEDNAAMTEIEAKDTVLDDDMDTTPDGLMTVARRPLQDRETLEGLLPPMASPSFPVLTSLAARIATRFLCIWSIAVFFVWDDVIRWIRRILADARITIVRAVRTNENGSQAFWLKMSTERDAQAFRGLIAGAHTSDMQNIGCDFVDSNQYSKKCGQSTDGWTPEFGLELKQSPSEPFASDPRALPKLTLAERLSTATGLRVPTLEENSSSISLPVSPLVAPSVSLSDSSPGLSPIPSPAPMPIPSSTSLFARLSSAPTTSSSLADRLSTPIASSSSLAARLSSAPINSSSAHPRNSTTKKKKRRGTRGLRTLDKDQDLAGGGAL